jgi:2-polyprenyl-6-methoxyphenol hydroxylase-like FAD-dependent oxidoreductase
MKITCVGGGPASLYFAILMKRQRECHDVTVFERYPAGRTYGWGVTLLARLIDLLERADPQTAFEIRRHAFRWDEGRVIISERQPAYLGGAGISIGRSHLLEILVKRATDLGVQVQFEHEVRDIAEVAGSDLIVAGDGANSRLRGLLADQFRTRIKVGRNKYLWLGTTKVFDVFTFGFVATEAGWIWYHGYGFNSDTSTFLVECSPETWAGLGFDQLGTEASIRLLECIFAQHLEGHPLMAREQSTDLNPWLSFRAVTNERWHHGNVVLLGDAAHTTHFTIGSGTSLAIEDAIGLAAKLHDYEDVKLALSAYTRDRRADLRRAQLEAFASARWFESIQRYTALDPYQFGTLLMTRRSRFQAHLPPLVYYHLFRTASSLGKLPLLRRLRDRFDTRRRRLLQSI